MEKKEMSPNQKKITANDMIQATKRLRKGEEVICLLCEKGTMKPTTDKFETAHCFVCSVCGKKLIIN